MSLEQQLRQAYDRAAASEPNEAGAYDRFLHRRARHRRAVVVGTSLTLVAALALTVLVPRVLADRRQLADRPQPLPKSLVTIPDQGFQLQVPNGWKVSQRDGPLGLLLVPTRPSQGPLPATIMVHTEVLDPLIYPGPRPSTPSDSPVPTWNHPVPGGPFTKGRRSDGRWYVRSDHANQLAGAWGQRYELAWPYRCAVGAKCPWEARYRGLVVEAASPRSERGATQAVLRRIVEAVRPIGNAVAPEPVAARRLCRIPEQRLRFSPDVELQTPRSQPRNSSEVGLEVEFKMSSSVVSCRLHQRIRLELWEGGRLADVRGNGSTVELDGALPEGSGGSGWIAAAWRWRNWCGGPNVTVRYGGLNSGQQREQPALRPRCLNPTKPSTLERATWPR
jgi:hypothetical protein